MYANIMNKQSNIGATEKRRLEKHVKIRLMGRLEQDYDAVLLALITLSQRATTIVERVVGRETIPPLEQLILRALYGALKEDLRDAARSGKMSAAAGPPTASERTYFAPAALNSYKALHARINTNPITSNWIASLMNANEVLCYYVELMTQELQDVRYK